ncbi:Txe/YoeB family addiction module toxin [Roseicella aquatilis]|uniref:Putative mRNA interferase YoeB n=1 Tax=Roseicella aquatilis TaxID=2527868 RepID=A0A4R4DDD3_9PROT|nr:Txe/YoeB family addiction module toxin [Roseicella aquatilis]TCZ58751.1 Txe/YoeB family addiction module toxin [Roseicella aquatilis]
MRVLFTGIGWQDTLHWAESDPGTLRKVNELIKDIRRSPSKGIGKPEPLKGALSGWWSRRITGEHRIVYRVVGTAGQDQQVEIAACRYHY